MAGTMNFFRAQDEARGRTTKLVVLLVLAIVVLAGTLYALAVLGQHKLSRRGELDWFQGDLFFWTAGVALIVIIGGSLVRIAELSKGGGAIAERLGGRLVGATTKDAAHKAGAHCANCALYTGKAGAKQGGCGIFPKNSVHAAGWCKSWVKKP